MEKGGSERPRKKEGKGFRNRASLGTKRRNLDRGIILFNYSVVAGHGPRTMGFGLVQCTYVRSKLINQAIDNATTRLATMRLLDKDAVPAVWDTK
jgi:hypothetical protein